jgi:tight adherence protein B
MMSPASLRFLLLTLLFGTVVLATEAIVGFIRMHRQTERRMNKRLKMVAGEVDRSVVLANLRRKRRGQQSRGPLGRISSGLEASLVAAGLPWSGSSVLAFMMAATGGLFILGAGLAKFTGFAITAGTFLLLAVFAAAAGLGVPTMILSRLADRRHRKMEEQFPVALDVFVRGLRAGHPVSSVLHMLTQEMPDPIGSEFGLAVDEVTYGADIRDALQNMADRCRMEDMNMFVVSLSIQAETGGNLAEILENLSGVIRERAGMMMQVKALSSEGRMTGVILTALPVLSFVALFILNPKFYLDVAQDPAFVIGFCSLLVLYAIGFFSIRRMIDLKV